MNKKYQHMLVDFMQATANILKNNDIQTVYFDDVDKENIMKWNDYHSEYLWEEVWNKIAININSFPDCYGLDFYVCPFCLFFIFCEGCDYGENHGICNKDNNENSYGILMQEIVEKNINANEIFSNDVYKKIIKKIESEYE
jgi:hypothetical protein